MLAVPNAATIILLHERVMKLVLASAGIGDAISNDSDNDDDSASETQE